MSLVSGRHSSAAEDIGGHVHCDIGLTCILAYDSVLHLAPRQFVDCCRMWLFHELLLTLILLFNHLSGLFYTIFIILLLCFMVLVFTFISNHGVDHARA